MNLEEYLSNNPEVYDRFTFDSIFRKLLKEGYDNEEAKDLMLYTCQFSTLVFQERVDNKYYLKITGEQEMSDDLILLQEEIFFEHLAKILIRSYEGLK